jgi:DNA-binding response OmpR family regulator
VDAARSILLAEDDEATRRYLADNLAADGFTVFAAAGADEALRAIEARAPSLLLLDLTLENGSGLELLDRVRAADGLTTRVDPQLPVIVLTGRAGDADRVRSFAAGPTTTCASRSSIRSWWPEFTRCSAGPRAAAVAGC